MTTALVLAATPTPSGTGTPKVDADLVTPGLWGFVALFVLAVAVYFLGRSMARRIQRVNHRARLEQEERAAAQAQGAGPEQEPPAQR
ncbi:hypothetical protein AB2L28_01580 [Kineococcus sp. TBRC 1896]|uniref:CcmD family protein n=1 Tax=Kineococcus mangrovi TaxID=1660183 RepID=A0ABV4HWX9_9ACTN